MAMDLNPNLAPPRTDEFEQYILNLSFDHRFKLLMTGMLGYNATTDNYDRVQVDTTGNLKVNVGEGILSGLTYDDVLLTNEDANANPQTATFKKSGSTVASLSLTYNASGKLTRLTRTS